jgi:parallel beta-helix repeat protein
MAVRGPRVFSLAIAAVLLASSLAVLGAAAGPSSPPQGSSLLPPSNDLCGKTIVADLELDHDLICMGSGITVGADGVEIELNGHSITGPSRGPPTRGITVIGRTHVSIEGPGTVTNFRTGILISNSHDVEVEKVTVSGNGFRAFGDGDGIRILGSTHVEIEKCDIRGNGNDGVEIMSSTDVELEKNKISENGNGIAIAATGNEIEKNTITANACGVKGSTAGNELHGNKLKLNTVDYC